MRRACLVFFSLAIAITSRAMLAKGQDEPDPGRKVEQAACLPCHSLRLIESQRLSAQGWQKEVDKMIGWGAVVPNRQILIDYLSEHYSNSQALPAIVRSKPDNK